MMRLQILAVALILAALGAAHAETVLPALTTFDAQVTYVDAQSVKAALTAPKKIESTWDKISARYAGCSVEGKRDSEAPAVSRTYIQFEVLVCKGKAPLAINAMAVSPADLRTGVPAIAVSDPITILLRTGAIAP